MATVYPIMAANPPCSPAIKEEKKLIEEKEAERRRRVVRRNSVSSSLRDPSESDEWWHVDQVESFYRECSIGREDNPDPAISAALKVWLLCHLISVTCMRAVSDDIDLQRASSPDSRTLDLSGVQIIVTSATILSDVFTIEWGLRKLILKECDLDEHVSITFMPSFVSDLSGRILNLCYTHC
jgi:protein phosphatase 1 regulatory subunit 37